MMNTLKRRNTVNKLGQPYGVLKNLDDDDDLEDRLNKCEKFIDTYNSFIVNLAKEIPAAYYGYHPDKIIFMDLQLTPKGTMGITYRNPLTYVMKTPGAVEISDYTGPTIMITKNAIQIPSIPFAIKPNDILSIRLIKDVTTFQDSIGTFIIKYKLNHE